MFYGLRSYHLVSGLSMLKMKDGRTMRNPNRISASESRQTPIDLTNRALEAISLKPGPRLLLARIVLWSGRKGRCWHSIGSMAEKLGVSTRQIQRWKGQLIAGGFLAEHPRGHGAPYWFRIPNHGEHVPPSLQALLWMTWG